MGEALEPAIRSLLTEIRGQALGRTLQHKLLNAREAPEGPAGNAAPQAIGDALELLGVDPDVYEFIENLIDSSKRENAAMAAAVGRLEEKLEDILSSVEVRSEIQRQVTESLGAREAQLREEWERGQETARLETAGFYVDLAASIESARSSLSEDARAVMDILIRRLERLLSSRFDIAIIGRVGEVVRFDPVLHQYAAGNTTGAEDVTILRPGIRKIGSADVVSKAVVE